MRLRTILATSAVVLIAAMVSVVAIVLNIDFSQYRGLVIEKVREATGRELRIGGELKLVPGLSPSLAVGDVSFSNAAWGSRPQMIAAKRLEVQVDLLPLLSGNLRVKRLVVIEADILLETDTRGRGNWELEAATPSAARPAATTAPQSTVTAAPAEFVLPQIHEVYMEGVLLVFRDGEARKTTRFSLGHLRLRAAGEAAPLRLDTLGTYNDFYFEIEGQSGSAAMLSTRGETVPVEFFARLGDAKSNSTARVSGRFADLHRGSGYDLRLTVETDEAAQFADYVRWAQFAEFSLPKLGPLRAELRINDLAPGGKPSLPALKLEIGRPDLAVVKIDGAVRDPLAQKGLALNATVEGREIGALSGFSVEAVPQKLPPIPMLGPFRIAAKVTNGPGDRPSLSEFRAELGSDDLLKIAVEGAIRDPLEGRGLALDVSAEARDLAALGRRLDMALPLDGELSLRARVADTAADRYALTGFRLSAGGSDIGGEATLSLAGSRPQITATLASTLIDLGKLLPKAQAGRPAPAAPTQAAAPGGTAANDGRVFSADPLPLEAIEAADGEVRYRAATIRTPDGPAVRDLALQAALRGGELTVRPLGGGIGTGRIEGEATLNSRSGAFAAKISARGVELGAIDREVPGADLVDGGRTDADFDLRSTGKSVRALMAGLNGSVFLNIGPGTFTHRYADVLGVGDLMEIVDKSLPRQERSQLNCLIGRLDISNGIATPRVLMADTTRLTLAGTGTVNLGTERLDLLLDTRTKVTSLLSILPPIRVRGTFTAPDWNVDLGAGAGDAVGNVIGGLLRTPGNILGTLTGQQRPQSNACANALAQATGRPAPAAQQAPAQQAPAAPQQQQQRDPIQDLGQGIERGLRNLFGR